MNPVTVFIEEIRAGDAPAVFRLLQAYPELVKATTEEGVSVVLLAAYHQHAEVLHLLLERKPKLSIFEAAAVGNIKQVNRNLNEDPALLNAFSADGFTPLSLASIFTQVHLVGLLLQKGARVNLASRNESKLTPLHGAVSAGKVQVAHLLLQNGANVNARQAAGYTPLHQASYNGQTEMVDLLLYFGANPNLRLENGKTPLDIAREKGHMEVALLLRDHEEHTPPRQFGT